MHAYEFEIFVVMKGKTFRMEVFRIYDGESMETFKVVGGTRSIILQSNRPELVRTNSTKAIDWKLLEGDFSKSNPKDAAEALNKIIVEVEYRIRQRPLKSNENFRTDKDE